MEIDLVFNAKGGGRWDEEKPVENKPVENKPVESGGDYSTNSSIRSRDMCRADCYLGLQCFQTISRD